MDARQIEGNDFLLYMFKQDLEMLQRWAKDLSTKQCRTDGGLFGLWTNSGCPVVHVIHDVISTIKEYPFLQSKNFRGHGKLMLCRIGIWSLNASLHINNFAKIMKDLPNDTKFLFLDIQINENTVHSLRPVLCIKGENFYKEGRVEILRGENPFRIRPVKQINNSNDIRQFLLEIAYKYPQESGGIDLPLVKYSSTVQESLKDQWYTTDEGQNKLQAIHGKLSNIISPKNINISRDISSNNIMLLIIYDDKQFKIIFPNNFPELPAELEKEICYRTGHFQSIAKVSFKDTAQFVQSLIEKVSV